MRGNRVILIILFLLITAITVNAEVGHVKLLAVAETPSGYKGKIADLNLEIIKGKSRVFLDTFPLTKFDTQISTRFAKQISCDYLEADCSRYDFIYTIKSESGIIGGPSAGAATAVLTTAMLKALPVREDVAITGTINSGGLIGPVSGILKKIEAASENNIKIALIPKGTRHVDVGDLGEFFSADSLFNQTSLDAVEYGESIGVQVVEVSRLSEALEYFTGAPFRASYGPLTVNIDYLNTMKYLANQLCTRSLALKQELLRVELDKSLSESKQEADKLVDKSVEERKLDKYYSAASRCFAANIKYAHIKKTVENMSRDRIMKQAILVEQRINKSEQELRSRDLATIMDLQAFMVVKERLEDARLHALTAQETGSVYDYVFAIERFESAEAWSEFFGKRGRTYALEEESLKDSCFKKLSEADERIQYVGYFVPKALESTKESLDKAIEYADTEEYILCLFKASKTKAEADSLYSMLSVPEDKVKEIIQAKLDIAKDAIVKESKLGSFPILAYSYYEYTQELVDENLYSSLLYSQYALELSNLRMYFSPQKNVLSLVIESDYKAFMLFLGILIGILIGYYYRIRR